jgi:hypothetical protein
MDGCACRRFASLLSLLRHCERNRFVASLLAMTAGIVGCLTLRLAKLAQFAPRGQFRLSGREVPDRKDGCQAPRKFTYQPAFSVHHSAGRRCDALDLNQRPDKDF